MKLIQLIAKHLNLSRRKTQDIIDSGDIWINGKSTYQYSQIITHKDSITYQKQRINTKPYFQKSVYIVFYKPRGLVVTRKSLTYYYKQMAHPNLQAAGRLDKESEGLLIISNDGGYLNKVTHPRYQHTKTYHIHTESKISPAQKQALHNIFKNDISYPAANQSIIKLKEGKNRQIRRSFASAGLFVTKLIRVQINSTGLESLSPGQWYFFTPD